MRLITVLVLLQAHVHLSSAGGKKKTGRGGTTTVVGPSQQVRAREGMNGDARRGLDTLAQTRATAERVIAEGKMKAAENLKALNHMNERHAAKDAELTELRATLTGVESDLQDVVIREKLVRLRKDVLARMKVALRLKPDVRGWVKYYKDGDLLAKIETKNMVDRARLTQRQLAHQSMLVDEMTTFRLQDREIIAQRYTARLAGTQVGSKLKLKNLDLLEGLKDVALPRSAGKNILLGVLTAAGVVLLASMLYWVFSPGQTYTTSLQPMRIQQRFALAAGELSNEDKMKDGCMDMHAAATKVEGNAQESLSAIEWKTHLNTMRPIYHGAYAQTNAAGIKEINSREIVNWGAPAASPIDVIIPVDATALQRQNNEEANGQAEEHWSFNEFLRPISLQFELAEEHRNNIHETAFSIIRNATAFGFSTDSDRFYQVYAAYFGRMDIPGGCFKYVKEPKAIHAQYKDAREEQAIYESDTQIALDHYFAARSALPSTAPTSNEEI